MVHESDHNPRTVIDGLERENRLLRQRLVRLETGVSGVERMEMLEEQNRLLAAFQQVVGVIHGSFDMEEILDHMATQVLKVGIFRSLTIGVVDEKSEHIDLVRNLLCHTPEGVIAPSSRIVSSTHEVIDEQVVYSKPIVGRKIPLTQPDDMMALTVARRSLQVRGYIIENVHERYVKMAYFIPVIYADNVIAVLATGSDVDEQDQHLERIEALQPLIDQVALALDHARLYRSLEAERERLAVTLASIGDGVIATDPEGRVVLLNKVAETYSGWTQQEAFGCRIGAVLGQAGGESEAVLATALAGEAAPELVREMDLVSRDGVARVIHCSSAPIRDEGQQAVGAVFVLHDITQQQRMEDAMHRARRIESLGLLAGGIAHDFNNILASVLVNVSVLKLQLGAQQLGIDIIRDIEISMGQARELTQQIITFTRENKPEFKSASVGDLAREWATFVLRGSNVHCEFDIAPNLWPVEIDTTQISQVLQNLIINADQAMPDGGVIHIQIENAAIQVGDSVPVTPGAYVRCSVADTGSGIDPDDLHRIFDPYFTTKEEGTGVGLASALSIVHNHQGWITADSTPGAGTTFSLYLRASTAQAATEEDAPSDQALTIGGGRVLLMDDDDHLRQAAGRALGHLGYGMLFARHGQEAIRLYRRELEASTPVDAVILDLTVPGGMGAVEAARILLQLDPDARLIISTGYSRTPVLDDFRSYGFAYLIAKPYTMEELGEAIQWVLH